jgi:hypothetical protein
MAWVAFESGKISVVQFFDAWPSGVRDGVSILLAAPEGLYAFMHR